MALREIPNDIVAEQSVLGSMFLSNFALQKACDALTADSFYYDNNAKIFSTVSEMFNKGIPIDATTVTSELKNKGILSQVGGVEYLTEILDMSTDTSKVISDGYTFALEDGIWKIGEKIFSNFCKDRKM